MLERDDDLHGSADLGFAETLKVPSEDKDVTDETNAVPDAETVTAGDADTISKAGTDAESSGGDGGTSGDSKKGPVHISRIVAGVCALLIAAAAGAAVVADLALKNEDPPRIYSSSAGSSRLAAESTQSSVTTAAPASASAAGITAPKKTSASRRSRTTASKTAASRTVKTTSSASTAAAYSYPQDINTAGLDCFLGVNGINRTVAEGLVSYRERHGKIHNFEELLEIYGIGGRTLTVIEEHFFISGDDYIPQTAASEPVSTEDPEAEVRDTGTSRSAPSDTKAPPVRTTADTSPPPTDDTSESESSEAEPKLRPVNINTADAEELAECLLLKPELAEAIVRLRENIGKFRNDLELLYVDGFSNAMLVERREYIRLFDM